MSNHGAADASQGGQRSILTARDEPEESPLELSRRTFMAGATLAIGGIVGLVLAVPIVGGLIPSSSGAKGSWSPLTADEFKELQVATSKPVKLDITLSSKDSYLPEQSTGDYVWGIKVDPAKFLKTRTDLPPSGKLPYADGTYDVVNMSFVILSPICPHLGCRPIWSADANRFQCPCHGSQFDLDGEHLAGPAPRGMDPLPLREQTGIAQVMWIRYQSAIPDRVILSYQA